MKSRGTVGIPMEFYFFHRTAKQKRDKDQALVSDSNISEDWPNSWLK